MVSRRILLPTSEEMEYYKKTPRVAPSCSEDALRSAENVKSSLKKKSMSRLENEGSEDGEKHLQHSLGINHRDTLEGDIGNQRDRHRHRSPEPPPQNRRHLGFPTRPTQGDLVLIQEMDPNRPDVAPKASEQVPNSESDNDSKMKDGGHTEYRMIEPVTVTTNVRPSPSLSESQCDPIPISSLDTGPSSHNIQYQTDIADLEFERPKLFFVSSPIESVFTNPSEYTREPSASVLEDESLLENEYDNMEAIHSEISEERRNSHEAFLANHGALGEIQEPAVEQNHATSSAAEDHCTSAADLGLDIDFPETIPDSPSYASSVASVFSVRSVASSATDLSRSSSYSVVQIASATKVLLSIFQKDDSLLTLYKNAMDNPHIGPDRLRRNLRRIFNVYSKQLEDEAKERLEFLTSRLVRMKSGLLANSIVEKLQTPQAVHLASRDESSDEDGNESSEAYPVNEEAFEDLDVFREFLVKSDAFQNLHTQVQTFVMGKSTQTADASTIETEDPPAKDAVQRCLPTSATQAKRPLTWENWTEDITQAIDGLLRHTSIKTTANAMMFLFTDAFMLATDGILIALGQLEPALKPGMTRLRWRCSCGDRLYSDVLELRAGGISELTGHMLQTSGTKVHVSSYSQQNINQRYIAPRPIQWIKNAWRKFRVTLGRPTQLSASLPQHNTQYHSNASSAPNNQPHQDILHLLACIHRNRVRISLNQDRIEGIDTDRNLLCFLRRQYTRHRSSILRMISLKKITGLWFVKFWLPIGGSVSIRHHERCCVAMYSASTMCECIPPAAKVEPSPGAEYRCVPGPPATYPPIPPEYLSSLITCPTDVHEKDTWIWDQLPKRTCGQLQGQIGKPAEGWGVYYQEGWDHEIIAFVIFVILAASLIFGILWSRYRSDIQGGFGVGGYLIAFCTALLCVVANLADKKG